MLGALSRWEGHARRWPRLGPGPGARWVVSPRELALVAKSGYRRWPPRLPEQPIFYPVTNEAYAREHEEYWIPAEELEAMNDAIVGGIEVVTSYARSAE